MTKFQVRKGTRYEVFLIDKLDRYSRYNRSVGTTHHFDWDQT